MLRVNGMVWISLLAAGLPGWAQGPGAKLAPELNAADLSGNLDVIIQYKNAPTAADHFNVQTQGGQLTHKLKNVTAGGYSVPGYALAGLAAMENVAHISVDHKVKAHLDLATAATNATAAWQQYGVTGKGIGVVVIDSGVGPNSDLTGNLVHSEDLTGGDGLDHYGHGTHVAGIIAGSGAASHCATCTRNLQGMAPGASIISLRVLDANGETTDGMLIAAIDRAITLKAQYNIRVMNLSVGRPVYESYAKDPVCQAVEQAWNAGIVVVAAAGNDGRLNLVGNHGYGTINSPANDPMVLTVGAMKTMGTPARTDDNMASYSSKGPSLFDGVVKPDLVAPGNLIVSTMPSIPATLPSVGAFRITTAYYNSKGSSAVSGSYYMLSGTSMATAVVSGAVADLLQAQPYLTPDQVKIKLMSSSYKTFPSYSNAVDSTTGQVFTDYYDPFTRGAGYLDLQAALAMSNLTGGTAASPVAQRQLFSGSYGMSFNFTSAWFFNCCGGPFTTSSTWGSSEVAQNGAMVLQTPVTATLNSALVSTAGSVLAGTSSVWGNSAVWGTSSIWGNSSVWGTSTVWGTATLLTGEN